MTETLCVLALDAADYKYLQEWGCTNVLLERHRDLETFSWSKDEPYTPEVWATVATGVSPEKHGIGEDKQELEWNNPLLRLASRVTERLPPKVRQELGRPFRERGFGSEFTEINESVDHVFDAQLSWPGLGDAPHLRKMWRTADDTVRGDLPQETVNERLQALTGQELGYLATMSNTDKAIVGAHAHVLDIAGHLFAEDTETLQEWYTWVDQQVGWLREQCEQLLILSDHGIQTTYANDSDPGSHSWRAFISSQGIDRPLPESVYNVRAWLEAEKEAYQPQGEDVTMDTPTETLEDLGYL